MTIIAQAKPVVRKDPLESFLAGTMGMQATFQAGMIVPI
jgi:hypothetical protein